FSLSHTAGRFMRFNVAQCEDQRIFRALNNAMAAPPQSRVGATGLEAGGPSRLPPASGPTGN
ncbi:MAG: phosphonate C-P lyase system protein PhnH, partial [Mesorhizobium sp.]